MQIYSLEHIGRICDVREPPDKNNWRKTQSTECLSSGEAELKGIAEGLAQAIGLQTIAKYLGFDLTIDVHSDATAAIGIARRRGMGRIRHIDCTDLWCQEKFHSGQGKLHNFARTEHPADILTKHADRGTLLNMLGKVGVTFLDGRSVIAPKTEGINSVSTRRGRRDKHRTAEGISVVSGCGKGSNRAGEDHIDHRESTSRSDDPKAALAPQTSKPSCKPSNVSAGPKECAKICSVLTPKSKVYPNVDISYWPTFDIEITHDYDTTTRHSQHTTSIEYDVMSLILKIQMLVQVVLIMPQTSMVQTMLHMLVQALNLRIQMLVSLTSMLQTLSIIMSIMLALSLPLTPTT